MEEVHFNPIELHSLHANIVDLGKKRKLIDEQLSSPIRKLNFREGSPGSEQSSNFSGEPVASDILQALHQDSEMDSNSFLDESEGAPSANSKRDISEVYASDESSTSSESCSSNYTHRESLHSVVHRGSKKVDNGETKSPIIDEFGYEAELKELLETDPEDLMLYSNGLSSDMFVLSSGRWKIKPDAQAEARKPTIDQEFEEYFSSLML